MCLARHDVSLCVVDLALELFHHFLQLFATLNSKFI